MATGDIYLYDLIHCTDVTKNRVNQATAVNPSPFDGLLVSVVGLPQSDVYTVVFLGLNIGVLHIWMPQLIVANLSSCADPNSDKIYKLTKCGDPKNVRFVLLASPQTVGDTILNFVGECDCWLVAELVSTYTEIPTIASSFTSCADCMGTITSALCDSEERTIGYAIKIGLLKPEPPDRGFEECCYSQLVFGDLSDTNPYRNDFSSVYFQKQTPTDTVVFEIVGASTGTTLLVDGTHGVLYPFDPSGTLNHTNPNLSYFKVEWRKILALLGEDSYTIRMNITIAGIGPTAVDSNSFQLRAFSIKRADHTVRIDSKMDGTLEKVDVNFKNSGYENSLRTIGYFGDAQEEITKDMVVFSQKKGKRYFEDQISMSNDPIYIFQADNIPECISRELRKFIIFGNEILISDYNLKNHSYEYELFPVSLDDISPNQYSQESRGIYIEMTFKDRSKDNRKTNC